MKRKSTRAEREHMAAVKALGCVLTYALTGIWETPCEVHHCRVEHGWGRSSHYATIGLTAHFHRDGTAGIHGMGREEFTAKYGVSELELLDIVNKKLGVA